MRIVILGGGISGLSAAWKLRRQHPGAKITLLEKTERLGGFIQTMQRGKLLFELGPRTFQRAKCPRLLSLIQEAGLKEELMFSDPNASQRYLWERGKLRSLSSLWPMVFTSFLKEPFITKSNLPDESIYDFASRRFGPNMAETLFDPMALGIYAGDIRTLSMRSCFPKIFAWEKEKGSCVRGMLSSCFKKEPRGLFTLRGGMGRLIETLAKKLEVEIILSCEVEAIEKSGILAGGRFFDYDLMISALPGSIIASLTNLGFYPKEASLWVATLIYEGDLLPRKGYGYLVPSKERQDLLGAIWDSSIFPEQNGPGKTCLTAMMRCGDELLLKKNLEKHLGLQKEPIFSHIYFASQAIPQFEVGYFERLSHFKEAVKKKFPTLVLQGNYLESPSVESCIYN